MAELYCDDTFLTSIFINSSKRLYDVNKVCPGPARDIRLRPQWIRKGIELPGGSIKIGYYVIARKKRDRLYLVVSKLSLLYFNVLMYHVSNIMFLSVYHVPLPICLPDRSIRAHFTLESLN